jgi:hypothetical protein
MPTFVHFKSLLYLCYQVKLTQILGNENSKCFYKLNGPLYIFLRMENIVN